MRPVILEKKYVEKMFPKTETISRHQCESCGEDEGFPIQFKINIPDGMGKNITNMATIFMCKKCAGADPTTTPFFKNRFIEIVADIRRKFGIEQQTEIKMAVIDEKAAKKHGIQ